MKIHIIGDTHFSHKNIKEYCDRPDDWTEQILEEIGCFDSDLLIHLGDVSLGNDVEWHKLFTDLPMKCWLILGNHDGKSTTWYMNHGWDFVARNFTIYIYGIRIFFSHRPSIIPPTKIVVKELARDIAHSELMVDKERSNFDINVHGHIHNRPDIQLPEWCKPFIIENEGYKPIELKEFLIEEIQKRSNQQQRSL